MSLSQLLIRVAATILVLLAMARLNGPKQISQMCFYDYVSGITVGSLAASVSTDTSLRPINGLIAIVLFLGASTSMGWISEKSQLLRRFLTGKPIELVAEGDILWDGLKKARLNMNELLSSLRYSGYFSLEEVWSAILEPTGKMSIQPKGSARPPKTVELDLSVPNPGRAAEVIIDGVVLHKNLELSGKDEEWLAKELEIQGIGDFRSVGLATISAQGTLTAYRKKAGRG